MREEFGTPGGVTELDVKMAKIKAEERADKREKRQTVTLVFLGLLAFITIVGSITYGATKSNARSHDFKIECLERGGVVSYGECYSTVTP